MILFLAGPATSVLVTRFLCKMVYKEMILQLSGDIVIVSSRLPEYENILGLQNIEYLCLIT